MITKETFSQIDVGTLLHTNLEDNSDGLEQHLVQNIAAFYLHVHVFVQKLADWDQHSNSLALSPATLLAYTKEFSMAWCL